ncbi:hypothetical protein LTR60_006897, partial [Cryomyces antarcticus]
MSTAVVGAANARLEEADAEGRTVREESQDENRSRDENRSQDENAGQEENNAEKGGEGPPQPVGFWDHRLKHVRHEAFGKWLLTTVVLMCFILGVLSIYWAVFYHAEKNLSSLVVYIVDFDGQVAPFENTDHAPVVGPALVKLGQQLVASPNPTLGWGSMPPSAFNNDPLQVRKAVFNWDAWAAVIINPNATAMLYSA